MVRGRRRKGDSSAVGDHAGENDALRPLSDEAKHRHEAHQARVLQLAAYLVLERVSRDKRVVHLRDHLAIDDVEELADCLQKCVMSMRSPRTSKCSGLW